MPVLSRSQSKGEKDAVLQGLEYLVKSLQDLQKRVESAEDIVSITINHHNDVKRGAPYGVDIFEILPTGDHNLEINIEIVNIKEREHYNIQSAKWDTFAD